MGYVLMNSKIFTEKLIASLRIKKLLDAPDTDDVIGITVLHLLF